jgi:single-strand DNA-binding protein
MTVNRCIFIGNLGKDIELRSTQTGKSVASFPLAIQGAKTDNGYLTEWLDITVWDKLADNCSKYLSKGSKIYVEGRIQTRKWQDKNGQDRYTTECVAQEVKFLDSKSQEKSPNIRENETPTVEDIPF